MLADVSVGDRAESVKHWLMGLAVAATDEKARDDQLNALDNLMEECALREQRKDPFAAAALHVIQQGLVDVFREWTARGRLAPMPG